MIGSKSKALKEKLIVLCLLISCLCFGQRSLEMKLESRRGYEYNVFNANENKIIVRDGEDISALQSGYFQHLGLSLYGKIKSNKHMVKLGGTLRKDIFSHLKIANLFRPNARIKYSYKAHKNHVVTFEARYRQFRTNRLENGDEVLRPPRAFSRLQFSLKYKFKISKRNTTTWIVDGRKNDYFTDQYRSFYYRSWGSRLSITQRLKKSNTTIHALHLEGGLHVRYYDDISFDEEEEVVGHELREWHYIHVSGAYKVELQKRWKCSFGVNGTRRKDLLQDKYGYNEYQPFFDVDFRTKGVKVSFRTSRSIRKYGALKARADMDFALEHKYWRASLDISMKVSQQLTVVFRSTGVSRRRNYEEGAKSFMSYDNAVVSLGVRFEPF